jgi:hypothetical protein
MRCIEFFCLLALLSGAATQAQVISPTASVSLIVTDGMGEVLQRAKMKSFRGTRGVELGEQFRRTAHALGPFELYASDIPYDMYIAVITVDGFPEIHRKVEVSSPNTRIFVSARTATVHVLAVTGFGIEESRGLTVESFQDGGKWELKDHFTGSTGKEVPYGEYVLRAESDGNRQARPVDVFEPDVWVLVAFDTPFDFGESRTVGAAPSSLVGTVTGLPSGGELIYMRLVGAFRTYIADTKLRITGTTGAFSFTGEIPPGRYILVTVAVTQSSVARVLDVRDVAVVNGLTPPVTFELGAKNNIIGG